MRVEKQGSRGEGGRYISGFRQLFEWNMKSRKKLFPKTTDVSEQLKQKRNSNMNKPINQHRLVIEDDKASNLILKGCASSLINEGDYSKAPGVIARLMGLDSLPNSNFTDTQSNRSLDSQSMRNSSSLVVKKNLELEQKDYHQTARKQRMIEKFQTESLPPKSAGSVPITRHKLLSPTKSSRFASINDPARVMEAASRIPLIRTSSLPSLAPFSDKKPSGRRRLLESNAARNLKGQSMNKSWDGCVEPKLSISLALQAKVNVKKREGLIFNRSRSLNGDESISSQPNRPKNPLKKPSTNSVLKQNNQKQNCLLDRVAKSASNSSITSINSQYRKPVLEKSSSKTPGNSTNKIVNHRKCYMKDAKKRVRDMNDKTGNGIKSNGMDVVSFTFTSPMNSTETKNPRINLDSNRNSLNSATGGGSFSTFLDKKVRELTSMSSASVSQESSTTSRARINITPIFEDKRNLDRFRTNDLCSGFSSNDPQGVVCVTRPSFLGTTKVSLNEAIMMEVDTKFTTKSEPGYVKDILSDIESMFEDFTIGRSSKIVNPHVFDQLEGQRAVENLDEPKLRRKLVFDCVSEYMDLRCSVWGQGLAAVQRSDQLAEEVSAKISRWEDMKDCMVDEFVDKSMSGELRQQWLDYDVEAIEVGVEIERQLLDCLIEEALVDMLVP